MRVQSTDEEAQALGLMLCAFMLHNLCIETAFLYEPDDEVRSSLQADETVKTSWWGPGDLASDPETRERLVDEIMDAH